MNRGSAGQNGDVSVRIPGAVIAKRVGREFSLTEEGAYNMETWSQGGLRYFVIGDASTTDIDNLVRLFKAAGT